MVKFLGEISQATFVILLVVFYVFLSLFLI